jgi:hypothetical protein
VDKPADSVLDEVEAAIYEAALTILQGADNNYETITACTSISAIMDCDGKAVE